MTDVFISFTSRGATRQEWVTTFREELISAYRANYADELNVWDMSKNGPGTNFRIAIDEILKETLLLIVVLDPLYIDSPQTLYEIKKYIEEREKNYEPVLLIKVIKKRGEIDSDLRKVVDSNVLVSYFSKVDANSVETEFKNDDAEYKTEIQRLVAQIRKHKINLINKTTASLIAKRLEQLKDNPKIYVAFGDSKLEDNRRRFITQLIDSLKFSQNDKLKNTKVFPDDSTVIDPNYRNLSLLLCNENEYQKPSINSMLQEAKLVIIPVENNVESEAEELLKRMQHQINEIRLQAINNNLTVFILLNVPDALFETRKLKEELLNPAYDSYGNIKIFRKQDIAVFISSCVQFLSNLIEPVTEITPPGTDKFVYLIEYNDEAAVNSAPSLATLINKERENRAQLVEDIKRNNLEVITNFDIEPDAGLDVAIEKHKEWLSMSNGVIIYRGIQEEDDWCKNQQGETFKALRLLNKKDLKRAVYVDELQPNKKAGAYSIFQYRALINNPPDLNQFLCTI